MNVDIQQARVLRTYQVLCLILGLALLGQQVQFARVTSPKYVTAYQVQVDPAGEILSVSAGVPIQIPEDRLVFNQLGNFIRDFRSHTLDPPLAGRLRREAISLLDTQLLRRLETTGALDNTELIRLRRSRIVGGVRVLPYPEVPHAYEVVWRETVFSGAGAYPTQTFRGIVTVRYVDVPPERLITNPLGLVITDFTYDRSSQEDS